MSRAKPAELPGNLKPLFDCLKCPAYCCSYERIDVTKRDVKRLAKHFSLTPEAAERKFTKLVEGHRALRHQKDKVYGTVCQFLDKETRRCTIYEARPNVCRSYPEGRRCGYYDFLAFERDHQDDPDFIPYELG
ncbi:MAG TPA: YkgJ family cysteine cluster protein [Thermoanaerobaculia bacterium]|nr:YkgJ family cysteine cluster protein [Thermoanaerobaculia bacterium]